MTNEELAERYKLEPATLGPTLLLSTHSIAISLKRIADSMEGDRITHKTSSFDELFSTLGLRTGIDE